MYTFIFLKTFYQDSCPIRRKRRRKCWDQKVPGMFLREKCLQIIFISKCHFKCHLLRFDIISEFLHSSYKYFKAEVRSFRNGSKKCNILSSLPQHLNFVMIREFDENSSHGPEGRGLHYREPCQGFCLRVF